MIIRFFILFVFSFQFSFGQDLKEDVLKMQQYLDSLKEFSFTVDYNVSDSSLQEKGRISLNSFEEGFYYQNSNFDIVINASHTIMLDHENYEIVYSLNKINKVKKNFSYIENFNKQFEETLKAADSVYITNDDKGHTFYVRTKNAYFNLTEMHFNGLYFDFIKYYYNDQYLEESQQKQNLYATNFIRIEAVDATQRKMLDTAYYMLQDKDVYTLTDRFKDYRIIFNPSFDEYFK